MVAHPCGSAIYVAPNRIAACGSPPARFWLCPASSISIASCGNRCGKSLLGGAVEDAAFVRDEFQMFEPLLAEKQGDEAPIIGQVRLFAMTQLEHSRRGLQHAWALKHLAERFPASTIAVTAP